MDSKAKSLLLSGGFRSGKTLVAIIKLIDQHLTVKKNRALVGRLTYPELRDTTQKQFFDILPPEWIYNWKESEGCLTLHNKTEVLFRHLDTVSEEEIRGLELGVALLSQVEEIKESVVMAVKSRLNMQHVPCRQLIMDCNPTLFWAYKDFKQNQDPDNQLIEFSMLDNEKNLPADYIQDMMKRPESWKRQFVYGIWDESLLSDRSVIPIEYIQMQKRFVEEPIRRFEGIDMFEDVNPKHHYQCGVDPSEGVGRDRATFSMTDCYTGNQVAFWKGQIPPDLLVDKVVPACKYFNEARVVPEINSIGLAFLSRLKDKYDNIYERKVYDRDTDSQTKVLGWKTTTSTKPLLVDNYLKHLREGTRKIRSKDVVAEMPTFVYTDETRKQGMGAQSGFHDDAIIADMLSCIEIEPYRGLKQVRDPLKGLDRYVIQKRQEQEPSMTIVNF